MDNINFHCTNNEIRVIDCLKIDNKQIARCIANETNRDDQAFAICSIGDIVRKYKYLRNAMPRVHPYYAVKCNNESIVLETLATLGAGFDCASPAEIDAVKELKVTPERIIFANPAKPKSFIEHAVSANVDLMTFDCEEELFKIKQMFEKAKLVLRIRSDAKKANFVLGKKFGCDPVNAAPKLLRIAKELKLDVVGVSFHVGSLCREPEAFDRAIVYSKNIFDIAQMMGFNFTLLDIGGGFDGFQNENIDQFADIVNACLDEYFPNEDTIRVISEPGRYLVQSAFSVYCNIHTKKYIYTICDKPDTSTKPIENIFSMLDISKNNNECIEDTNVINNNINEQKAHLQRVYYVNDGIFGLFSLVLYEGLRCEPEALKATNDDKLYVSTIWGPTCDSTDRICDSAKLPDLAIGDWISFDHMGAYTLPLQTNFNSIPKAKLIYTLEKKLATDLKAAQLFSKYQFIEFEVYK